MTIIATITPATGETVQTFTAHDDEAIEARLARAAATAAAYRRTSFAQRAACMHATAELLERDVERWARLMTLEMGKLLPAGRDEARKCAWACRWYAENAERLLADEPVTSSAARSWVTFQPLGAVLAIMPWNFPFWQVFRFAAPALMAGNVGLLKHASNVPQCALAIEEIFRQAGFPEGVFQTLLVGTEAVAELIEDPRVAAVTLTGSDRAGSAVARTAGAAIKKTVLELGGSDPFIVMPSADLDEAASTAVKARTVNSGQSCIAAKRFIVHERVADAFTDRFVDRMRSLRVGDPMDETTQVGPLATEQIARDLDAQVQATLRAGARVLTGGHRLTRPGYYYAPTVLTDVPPDSPAAREELFGPVASVFRASDLEHAIRLANDSAFGLGSAVWTRDDAEARRLIADLETGQVFVNGMVASDPRLPFGGVKRSGYGRELGAFGIREFVNIKTVWIGGPAQTDTE